jgi:hypothetical protein
VYVDGQRRTFDDFDSSETCSYKQLPPGISSTNVNVTVVVIGVLVNGRRQTSSVFDWSFQLNEVLYVAEAFTTHEIF